MFEPIAICPICNYAFPHSEIKRHADDHFSNPAVEADRRMAAELQREADSIFAAELQRPFGEATRVDADSAYAAALQQHIAQRRCDEEDARVEADSIFAAELQRQFDEAARLAVQRQFTTLQQTAENAFAESSLLKDLLFKAFVEAASADQRGMGPAVDYQPTVRPSVGPLAVPPTWTLASSGDGYALRCVVPKDSAEYNSVVQPFLATLHAASPPPIRRLERIQNPEVYAKFVASHTGSEGWFYHGCRQGMDAEISIIRGGFNVNRCVSGGANFGTWFAYNSQYSCGGYAFTDETRGMHLFVCRVATENPAMHTPGTMIVVRQDMAYPSYLVVFDA